MLKINNVKPMFTSLVTTMEKYEDDAKLGSLIDGTKTSGTLKEYQTVVAVGSQCCKDIKVGDKVMINPQRFANVSHKHKPNSLAENIQQDTTSITYSFDVININGEDHLLLQDRDIMYVFEGEEVTDNDEVSSNIIIPDSKLILN